MSGGGERRNGEGRDGVNDDSETPAWTTLRNGIRRVQGSGCGLLWMMPPHSLRTVCHVNNDCVDGNAEGCCMDKIKAMVGINWNV